MADIVNLRRFKKAKSREDAAKIAEERRVQFGRSKADKSLDKAQQELDARKLDLHKRDD